MEYIYAKTIVNKKKSDGWFDSDYNMNIYKGCSHGCIYCDSRSLCYKLENFDKVKVKQNAVEIIKKELQTKKLKGVIGTGSMSDPYNPYEKELKLTRQALNLMDNYGFGVAIATKSSLVVRDKNLLSSIQKNSPVIVKLTITCSDDDLSKILEPNVDVSSKRFEALRELIEADVYSGILLMPILPYINDTEENILGIVKKAKEAGAKFIYPAFGLTMRDGQREYLYSHLETKFPGIREKYMSEFGKSYICKSKKSSELWKLFTSECKKNDILYKMQDINISYREKYKIEQLSFF